MKILYAGYHNPHFISFAEYVERAITGLGHELATCDYCDWLIPGRIRDRVHFLHEWDVNRINENLIRKVKKFSPDVVLVNGGYTIPASTVLTIKSFSSAVFVNWIADFPLKFVEYERVGPYYDYFFTSGTDSLARYRAAGHVNGRWLPFACDREIHRPVAVSNEDMRTYGCDICFVGSNYTERVELLEKLAGFDCAIWGLGWHRMPDSSPVRKMVRGGSLTAEQWIKAFNASKIVLNIIGHRCDVMEPYVDEKEFRMTNTKVFEILGCGAFQLVDAKADVMALFEQKKHLVWYRDGDELVDLVKYYLERPQERKTIAEQGRREVLEKHTYRHRIREILSIVAKDRGSVVP
jgi:spore maturation protein CgeB